MSDILRYIIIEQFGGWYVDTDITPVRLYKLAPPFGFYINIIQDLDLNPCFTPSILGAIPHSMYCQQTLKLLLSLHRLPNTNLVEYQSTKHNYLYITSTIHTTGRAGFLVCKTLLIKNQALLEEDENCFTDDFKKVILPYNLFQSQQIREKSWYSPQDANLSNEIIFEHQCKVDTKAELYKIFAPLIFIENCVKSLESIEITVTNKVHSPAGIFAS